jgi:phosphonate transport system ATP-binding protein
MDAILKIENVSKRYPNGVQALKGVSFEVSSGEFVAIIGPSGSGKSTVLRCINRLVEPSGGEVTVAGMAAARLRGQELRRIRRKIGMIFQHYNLVNRLTVLQNVMHGRLGYMTTLDGALSRYREEDKQTAVRLLERIGLGQFLYNRVSELSGGQRQRVGIARALMQEPVLLLCDEPIASLDPGSSKIIMDLIRSFAREKNIACVVNLHQVDVALEYATRIIGIREGSVRYDGPPEGLGREKIEEIYGTAIENLIIHGEATA